ncbi:MAG TPA: thioredoxin family protein [Tepidisphaeraceae bacterium]|jgi:peroxiredoxin
MRNRIYVAASLLVIASIALVGRSFAEDQKEAVAAIGAKAPDFTLQDQNGKNVSLHDFAGKIVVLEWTNPECPFVQRQYKEKTMTTLANQYQDKGVIWLAINSSSYATNDTSKQWAAAQGISYPELNDSAGNTGKAYHATNTPDMYVIAADGTLVYSGAIDNDPDGDMSSGKINYVKQALDEILSGKPVSTPQTKPYGCSVKYAG